MSIKEAEEYAQEVLGMDTSRIWATQCQVHRSGPLLLLVFRETANVIVTGEDGGDHPHEVRKNVASILMTAENAEVLGRILTSHFADEEAANGE